MKIKSSHEYYVLLCDCGKDKKHQMICAVIASKKEAQDLNKEVKDCVARHTIRKCKLTVEY